MGLLSCFCVELKAFKLSMEMGASTMNIMEKNKEFVSLSCIGIGWLVAMMEAMLQAEG